MALDMDDPQYRADLQDLKDRALRMKADAFDMVKGFADGSYSPRDCGYKDVADAVTRTVLSAARDIDKEYRDFVKRYPD